MKKVQKVYCIDESNYSEHLTKGNAYTVLEVGEEDKINKLRVLSDKGNRVWISRGCFSEGNVPMILSVNIDDAIIEGVTQYLEVTIEFDTREKRWMIFMTPSHVEKLFHSDRNYFLGGHIVFVPEINETLIYKVISEMDSQNEIIDNSNSYNP